LKELRPPDFVITNPPRTGMDPRVVAELNRLVPERIVYISCDPATLARDIQRLDRFKVSRVQAFDLFPQTTHVESVALLEPV
jgi:23S rRNA (uracil1939-C5)-methyltransferase